MAIVAHELIDIDKDLSRVLLGNLYSHQRAYRSHFSQQYAKDMISGNWNTNNPSPIVVAPVDGFNLDENVFANAVNGQARVSILIDLIKQGKLKVIDGQHRLHGVDISGKTIQFLVVAVEDAIGFKFMDIGHTRKACDLVDIPNARNACAIAKRIAGLEQGFSFRRSIAGTVGITTVETVQYVDDNKDYLVCITRAANRIKSYVGCGAISSYGTVLHILENIYGEGTFEKIDEMIRSNDERTIKFVEHMNMLYGGRSSPRAEVTAHKFAEYCMVMLGNGKLSARLNKGLVALKEWESDYEPDKERSDFYDKKARVDGRKK